MADVLEIYDEVAYTYDGSLEGLLSVAFASYANHEKPTDVAPVDVLQPRFSQYVRYIETDMMRASRVRKGLIKRGGLSAFSAVRKASVSSDPSAGMAAYRFIRYVMDEHAGKAQPYSNIAHKDVSPIYKICRSVENECEHMRQFIRFEHMKDNGMDIWFARCNPRDSVVPLVMDHFAERFNMQSFIIYDEVHRLSGVYDGANWYLIKSEGDDIAPYIPDKSIEEADMQDAWKRFYRTVAVDARYNPELRQHFMPKRFWRNLTEMQEDVPALKRR